MTVDVDALLRSVDLVAVAGKYTPLRRSGREHIGLCPFHNDTSPSFYVVPEKGFAHCFACGWNGDAIKLVCDGDRVDFKEACARLGAEDFKPDPKQRQLKKKPERQTRQPPADTPAPDMSTRHWGEPVRVWTYRDAAGAVLFHVARYEYVEDGKRKKVTPQWTWGSVDGGKKWGWGMGHFSAPRPLYGLDRLAKRPAAPVLICEGEKAADAGAELLPPYVSITWAGGSNAVGKADWSPLKGRRVLIWPDRDLQEYPEGHPAAGMIKPADEQPGMMAAAEIAGILHALGVAEIKTLQVGVDS